MNSKQPPSDKAGMVTRLMAALMSAAMPLGVLPNMFNRAPSERELTSKAEQNRLIGAAQRKRERRQARNLANAAKQR